VGPTHIAGGPAQCPQGSTTLTLTMTRGRDAMAAPSLTRWAIAAPAFG